MFDDLKVSDWWFIAIAGLVGYAVVKHFMDKVSPNASDETPGAPESNRPDWTHRKQARQSKSDGQTDRDWFRGESEGPKRPHEGESRHDSETQAPPDPKPAESRKTPWYEVLEVGSGASLEEIKLAYKRKIRMYHPDKVAGLAPEFMVVAEAKAKEINVAYQQACALRGNQK